MDDFKKHIKNNWYWYLGTLVFLIILYYTYKAIKKSGAGAHEVEIPKDVVGEKITPEREQYLRALAEKLHEDINCIFCTRDAKLYSEVSDLGNNELVILSNVYNYLYEIEDEETFYQAIDKEVFAFNINYDLSGVVTGILSRLNKLGIA